MKWTLDDALKLVRLLQPETRKFGYHLALGGGVLNNGFSDKDLDLMFLPLDNNKVEADPDGMLKFLETIWGAAQDLRKGIPRWEVPMQPEFDVQETVVPHIAPDGTVLNETVRIPRPRMAIEFFEEPEYEYDANSVYRHKVKFMYSGDQRIDVFIIASAQAEEVAAQEQPLAEAQAEQLARHMGTWGELAREVWWRNATQQPGNAFTIQNIATRNNE